jgi:RNA polymerase sigma-70 factor (ECF subfamily)
VSELDDQLVAHRPDLLRHCYRMLGSFADAEDVVQDVLANAWKARASYAGAVPIGHWLMRIATNACFNELARRKRRGLPYLERDPATAPEPIESLEAADWLTPAPDARLFAPAPDLEARETVALAFLALLQRLPPRQRAVLLLKDVMGWSADDIADALDTTVASVSSALHRARETLAVAPAAAPRDPPPEVLGAYIRSWETHDIDALVRLLRDDVVFAMPPHGTWFRGAAVGGFFRGERLARGFWTRPTRVVATRANGQLALAFYTGDGDGYARHSLQVVEFAEDRAASIVQFIGADYLRGFDVPERIAALPGS